jgi:hypothetical protein
LRRTVGSQSDVRIERIDNPGIGHGVEHGAAAIVLAVECHRFLGTVGTAEQLR